MTDDTLASENATIIGRVRIGWKTKALVSKLAPGEIAVINHEDLDRVAAETLVAARPLAVINAAESMSGRYPNIGPLALCEAGIPLVDAVGLPIMDLADGTSITIDGGRVLIDGDEVVVGERLDAAILETRLSEAKATMGAELERFASNTLSYIQTEGHLLVDEPDVPDLPGLDFSGRHVLIVVRGNGYKEDLELLRRTGYLREQKPLLIGVDGGADALCEIGYEPDVIIGDFDSVSEKTLRTGAKLVVHGYQSGRAPGADRLEELGLDYEVYRSTGTSEDIAMLLAYERGAALLVAVGTHNSMVEFLDKGRAGMASTFLVRMKVGPILVDAKGVSRLYHSTVRTRDLLLMVLAAVVTMGIIVYISDPIRLVIETSWTTLTS